MKIEVGEENGVCVVILGEEITCDNHRAFTEKIDNLLEEGTMDVILDLSHVNYITSRGLGTIVGAYTVLKRRGGNLILAGANEEVTRSLAITRLDKVLTLVPSRAAALKALRTPEAKPEQKPASDGNTLV